MLSIRTLTVVGSLCFCLLLACGDKINPKGDYPTGTGGTEGPPPTAGIDGGEVSEAGAQGGTGGGGGTTAPAVSYTNDIVPLLKKACLCHVVGGQEPLLDTYPNVKKNAAASMQSINDGIMPPASALSSSDKALFQSWINAGTPNN